MSASEVVVLVVVVKEVEVVVEPKVRRVLLDLLGIESVEGEEGEEGEEGGEGGEGDGRHALVYLFVNFWERLNQLVVNIEQEYIHLFIE